MDTSSSTKRHFPAAVSGHGRPIMPLLHLRSRQPGSDREASGNQEQSTPSIYNFVMILTLKIISSNLYFNKYACGK